MKTLSTMMKTIMLIALMLSFGLSTAQAKDRISYFHSDISGSPIAATNESGEVLWEETYKPYGERLDNPDNAHKKQNNNWFTGKQEEADLGLQYFGARWYHQASGRFISRDPAAVMNHVESNPMMFNRYAYANNNPYRYIDPDGRLPILIPIAIFIAKEIASEGVEQVTSLPMPTVKNGLKYAIKQANKQIAKEGMEQAAKIVKATSKKGITSTVKKLSKVTKTKRTEKIGDKFTKTTKVIPGKGPGQSRAEMEFVKNLDGKVIRARKFSFDRANKLQHKKRVRGGPDGRGVNDSH